MSIFSVMLYANCDMFAMISHKGHYISWGNSNSGSYNDPYDYFNFLRSRSTDIGSKPNPDGYGLVYFPEDGYFNSNTQSWYLTGFDSYYYHGDTYNQSHPYNEPLNNAEDWIMDDDTEASIVYGHARNTDGNTGSGSHPFFFEQDGNHYVFMHNGTIDPYFKSHIYVYLNNLQINGTPWLTLHPFNSDGNIDSELYFHYIMTYILEYDDVVEGLYNALNEHDFIYQAGYTYDVRTSLYNDSYEANFILSDGESIFAFRNTELIDTNHCLGFFDSGSFVGLTTLNHNNYDIEIQQYELAVFTPYGQPENDNTSFPFNPSRIYNFLKPWTGFPDIVFLKGDVTSDINYYYPPIFPTPGVWFTDDVVISSNIEIASNVQVAMAGHVNIDINAKLTINNNASLNLNHASTINIDGGELFLDWGSTITGATPTTYGATPPGQPAGGEEVVPGDRIIAQNGGIITTDNPDELQPEDPEVIISSSSGERWDGIFIRNPDDLDDFWFVNCDISGIRKLSIENTGLSARNTANLKLYQTDFHDAGQIIARDEHTLSIIGENSTTRCNIRNNHATPIVVYDSPVYIDWTSIEDNGYDEVTGELLSSYCDGMALSYTTSAGSEVTNTLIEGNTGCGMRTYGQDVNVENDTIRYNEKHGIYAAIGTFNDLQGTTIQNNVYAEYVSVQNSYDWADEGNTIEDDTVDPSYYYDQYILMAYRWDRIDYSIDVTGNTIPHADTTRFYPYFIAYEFDDGEIPPEKEMLYSALDEMENGNYENADLIFQQIISDYPDTYEASTSIRGLLLIENYTDKDYAVLRSYIDDIQVSEETSLYKAKEDVKTKSYMKEGDYVTVISRLEPIINNPPSNEELIYAMIDQGYSYLQLEEAGSRDIPAVCSVKPRSFDEYQKIVQELENELLFFTQPENQEQVIPTSLITLHGNYPNPFNPTTTISFSLANDTDVKISVYNIKGQKVKTLISDHYSKGAHSIIWNGKDSNDKKVASGLYFYKLSSGKETQVKKMLLLK